MTHYTADQLSSFPWIVSTDTLRPDHLADAYLGAFDCLAQDIPEPFRSDLQQAAAYASDLIGPIPCDAWDVALDWAFDRLNELSPVGFYFGASDGDGACFGFWVTDDWAEALETLGLDGDDPAGWAELISRLDLDGIDPDNVEDAYQGRAAGYSEEKAGADYAAQLAEDLGIWNGRSGWPFSCIDWEDAWNELRMGDGFRLHDVGGGGEWLVFRSV